MFPIYEFGKMLMRQVRRHYADWRSLPPNMFAKKREKGRTRCRYLFCQYQSPIPSHLAVKQRIRNIALACERFDNVVLERGQIFSLFRILGLPKPQEGFQIGPHFNGEFVMRNFESGLGQLASAIYYVAVLAGLEIMEHHPAQFSPRAFRHDYVPLGLEACVTWAFQDLRFRNPFPFDIALQVQLDAQAIVVTLYGQNPNPIRAILKDEILETIPFAKKTLPAASRPKDRGKVIRPGAEGFRVRIVRQILEGHAVRETHPLVERIYPPITQIEVAST